MKKIRKNRVRMTKLVIMKNAYILKKNDMNDNNIIILVIMCVSLYGLVIWSRYMVSLYGYIN
jgi:hypothetical protein